MRETFGENAVVTEFIPSIGDLVRDGADFRRVVDRSVEYYPHGADGADLTVTVVLAAGSDTLS